MRGRDPTPPPDRDALIKQQQEEIAQLRDALRRAERERDRLKRRNEQLTDQLDAARRAGARAPPTGATARGRCRRESTIEAPAPDAVIVRRDYL